MIDLRPFRGLRYNPVSVGDVGRVLAPPYDVISDVEREQLHQSHPQNVIRLIGGLARPHDTDRENVYTRAQAVFRDWRARQVLQRDAQSGLYLYEQTFTLHERTYSRLGFIALLALTEAATGGVFRHEQTFQGPKADRARLLQAVRANLSPIFCLYPDGSDGPLHRQLRRLADGAPPVVDTTVYGERNRLWRLTDTQAIEPICAAMRPKQVVIADGHHRYEVALAHREISPAVMAYFGWLEDPAVVVLPIHRLVQLSQTCPLAVIEERLGRCAQVAAVSDAETLLQMLEAGREQVGLFGLYAHGQYRLLRLQADDVAQALERQGVPTAWAGLDVALLHHLLLPQLAEGRPAADWQMTYTKDANEAIRWAQGVERRIAFLLNPISTRRIQEVALQGYRLPQKSTYFYPKLLSGLVINPFD